ncbi:MAG TPA: Smr/MutS family protein [Longimicrobiales bacterium]|nr:Smr/MutS family protein [Longimicrobiales bacterium]
MGKRRTPIVSGGEPRTLHGRAVAATLDLHGFDARTAERRVASFLEARARTHRGEVVKIVTGKGTRSAGREVMRQLVLEAITDSSAHHVADWGVETGGGAYLVEIRG